MLHSLRDRLRRELLSFIEYKPGGPHRRLTKKETLIALVLVLVVLSIATLLLLLGVVRAK